MKYPGAAAPGYLHHGSLAVQALPFCLFLVFADDEEGGYGDHDHQADDADDEGLAAAGGLDLQPEGIHQLAGLRRQVAGRVDA